MQWQHVTDPGQMYSEQSRSSAEDINAHLIIKLARNCSRVQVEGEGEAASSRESSSLLVPLPGLEEMTREVS